MELRHLRYFIGVAEEENVSRAALKLHVSQPALSRQIRDLEDELGIQLLERSAKSVRLTKAGRVFLNEARSVLQRADTAVEAARAAVTCGVGELLVGYAPSLTARLLPAILRQFQTAKPGVRVKLHDLSTMQMLAGLRETKLHLALMIRPRPAMIRGLKFEDLSQDPLCVAVPPGHALAKRKTVSLAETAREPLVGYSRKEYPEYHEYIAALLTDAGLKPHIAEEHDSVSSLIAAVEAGCGVALVPASLSCTAGPRLKMISVSPPPKPLTVGAAWPPNAGPLTHSFLECARTVATQPLPTPA